MLSGRVSCIAIVPYWAQKMVTVNWVRNPDFYDSRKSQGKKTG